MSIKEISKTLKTKIEEGNVNLHDIATLAPPFSKLMSHFPALAGDVLDNIELSSSTRPASVTVKATIPTPEGVDLNLEIKLTEPSRKLTAECKLSYPDNFPLNIPGLNWFSISNMAIEMKSLARAANGRDLKSTLHGTMAFGNVSIPLESSYYSGEGLSLSAKPSGIELSSFNDIAGILGASSSLDFPSQLDTLGKVKLKAISVNTSSANLSNASLEQIAFEVGLKDKWELVPGQFSLSGISVNPQVNNPLGSNRQFTGNITGKMKIASTNIEMQANRTASEDSWVFEGSIPDINLSDLASEVLQSLQLPSNLPAVSFSDTNLSVTPASGDFSLKSQSSNDNAWRIDLGGKRISLDQLMLDISRESNQLSAKINGNSLLFGSRVDASMLLSAEPKFTANVANASLSSLANSVLDQLSIPVDMPDFSFASVDFSASPASQEFSISAQSFDDWHIPLGITGLDIEDVSCELSRSKADNSGHDEAGKVTGTVSIAGIQFDLGLSFPGDYVFEATVPVLGLSPIIQDLCGPEALMGFSAPSNFLNLTLNNLSISFNPGDKQIAMKGESALGQLQLLIKRSAQGRWQFATAMSPPDNWRFSALDSSLSSLDGIGFGGTQLLASNFEGRTLPTDFFELPDGTQISKGLNLVANLDTSNLGLDDLMDLDSLTVSAAIGPNPASLVISAGIGGTFDISDNVAMGNMALNLQPFPSNFAVGIKGEVIARIDNSDLVFVGTMKVRPVERSISFAATMLGEWRDPFGVKGFAVEDLAIDIGMGIVPPPAVVLPIIGLAGSVKIGSFVGSAAVKADTVTPSKSMISASFNRLFLKEVLSTFCDPSIMRRIPSELQETILTVGMEDVGVHVVPQATQIGELFYEPGFAFQGKLSIADFDAEFEFKLDYDKGLRIRATMDQINIANAIVIRGSGSTPNPMLDINLMVGDNPGVLIDAGIDILGVSAETLIKISDQGFYFMVSGNLFDLFEASIEASGGNIKEGGDFYLKVAMRNDLIAYLREEATKGIEKGVNEATQALSDAQDDIKDAQRAVDTLMRQINDMRRQVQRERDRDIQRLRNAENAVANERRKVNNLESNINRTRNIIRGERQRDAARVQSAERAVSSAQSKVNGLNRQINSTRATINRERQRDVTRLRNAQRDVSNAQNKVNGLRGEIRSSNARINTLKGHIRSKKRWLDNSPWFRKADRGIEYAAYAAAKNAEIGVIYAKIGGIETAIFGANQALNVAKGVVRQIERAARSFPVDADPRIVGLFTARTTANAALEVAKQTLRGIRSGINAFPIDADPRIAALFTAKETANAALFVAEQTLDTMQDAANLVPIDLDPRVASLFAAKETATVGLKVAEGVLEGAKVSVGGLGDAATFIVEVGLGGLFDVKAASFEGQLNAVKGGFVQLSLSVELMGQPQNLDLGFNFHDPLSGAKALGEQMLKALK